MRYQHAIISAKEVHRCIHFPIITTFIFFLSYICFLFRSFWHAWLTSENEYGNILPDCNANQYKALIEEEILISVFALGNCSCSMLSWTSSCNRCIIVIATHVPIEFSNRYLTFTTYCFQQQYLSNSILSLYNIELFTQILFFFCIWE